MPVVLGVEVYDAKAAFDAYFKGATHGAPWLAAASSLRNQAIVTQMRVFDRTAWQGAPTEPRDKTVPQPGSTQALAWPRTGLVDREGVAVDSSAIPLEILQGGYEYALELINAPSVQTDDQRGSNLKTDKLTQRVEGAVTVTTEKGYFRSTLGTLPPFPTIVQDYIGLWLASSVSSPLVFTSGTEVEATFTEAGLDWGYHGSGIP
jgi:hypothetical protein